MRKDTIVVHSGGLDSSVCLALAMREFGSSNVLSLSFSYNQRHSNELDSAAKICTDWGVDHVVIDIASLCAITEDALTNKNVPIEWSSGQQATSLVVGRNGLMARLASIHANHLGANSIYMGVMEQEAREIGYRDCSREYIALKQQILRIDLNNPSFEIRTPLIDLDKSQVIGLAHELGLLSYLLNTTISCYEGIKLEGCGKCPACHLRQRGLKKFYQTN